MLVNAGKMALAGYGEINTSASYANYGFTQEAIGIMKDQNKKLDELRYALNDQIVDIQIDNSGYLLSQRRAKRNSEKVKHVYR